MIADGDTALDLDTVADAVAFGVGFAGRAWTTSTADYVLEVSSPGVDRPLTTEKHFRRARGRKVELELSDGSQLTGRVGETRDGAIALVVRDGTGLGGARDPACRDRESCCPG